MSSNILACCDLSAVRMFICSRTRSCTWSDANVSWSSESLGLTSARIGEDLVDLSGDLWLLIVLFADFRLVQGHFSVEVLWTNRGCCVICCRCHVAEWWSHLAQFVNVSCRFQALFHLWQVKPEPLVGGGDNSASPIWGVCLPAWWPSLEECRSCFPEASRSGKTLGRFRNTRPTISTRPPSNWTISFACLHLRADPCEFMRPLSFTLN